jgi:3-phosphoshikimate 1-carboxyvinyltransferase
MGADIKAKDNGNLAPIRINGKDLKPIDYKSPVASAQVKSAIILAGLYADGITKVTEPYKSRDHTERMLCFFGAPLSQDGLSVSVEGMAGEELKPKDINVPGDISSASFFITLGILAEDAEVTIDSCGINPTRTGILSVLKKMGADIGIINRKDEYEPTADIVVRSSKLKAVKISRSEIPLLIDEIPLLALCAAQAEGTTVFEGIGELRVKETDRVASITTNLNAMGADVKADEDKMVIKGPSILKAARLDSFKDHRTAMMSAIAGCIAEDKTTVEDTDCIMTSFPEFTDILHQIIA